MNFKVNLYFFLKKLIIKILSLLNLKISNIDSTLVNLKKNDIVFIHIGKTAGSYINFLVKQLRRKKVNIKRIDHQFTIKDLNKNQKYFFSIRNPIERFVSAFNSRKLKGQPRNYVEWSSDEEIAFNKFETANDLAESLNVNHPKFNEALLAIESIQHTAMHQIDYIKCCKVFNINPPICIIRQEFFESDFNLLLKIINLNLTIDDFQCGNNIDKHKNTSMLDKKLTKAAINNLNKWYYRDLCFYNFCNEWMKKICP
jgi:hypothetical protein